jgi:uncharacterized membrane protein
MEAIVLVLIVVVILLIIQLKNSVKKVETKLDILIFQKDVDKTEIKDKTREESILQSQSEEIDKELVVLPPIAPEEEIVEEEASEVLDPVTDHSMPSARSVASGDALNQAEKEAEVVITPRRPFMERNPDLEKFIGENLLSKIGIVIFVIGMGFLVKLGIDNEVINEGMRVAIGVLIGGGMVGLAHYLRSSFAKFSSILIGGALAVLYFTIALAFHEYHLIPQIAAFIIMVLITAFGVLLAIGYDRKELAVLAIIGGFGTPFFVSTGTGNFTVLLTYILILDIGMLTLVYFKKWNVVNYLAYGFTYILFVTVYFTKFVGDEEATRLPLFLFLTSFYLIFFLMNIIYNVRNARKFKYPEIGMLLSNSGIYFGLGLSLVNGYQEGLYSGLFTALTALFNFGFAFTLYKRKDIDKNLLFLLIGLVLTFVSLIAPIQLKGNYITMFWAIESVLLLWLAQKSGIKLLNTTAIIVLGLMLISLSMDWQQNYYPIYDSAEVLNLFLNKAFLVSVVVMVSLIGSALLLKQDEVIEIRGFKIVWKRLYIEIIFAVVFYLGFFLELKYQFIRFEFENSLRIILLGIYNYAFIVLILMVKSVRGSKSLDITGFILSAFAVVAYSTFYLQQVTLARSYDLLNREAAGGFSWHYLLFMLFIVILVNLSYQIYRKYSFKSKEGKIALGILAFIAFVIGTIEIGHVSMIFQYGPEVSESAARAIVIKSVYPAVWTFIALSLMVLGMKFRLRTLRIASLALFLVTILKLFIYDLAGNTTGKIVSFIFLGVILLVISFLYQKLKFIFQDDDNKD